MLGGIQDPPYFYSSPIRITVYRKVICLEKEIWMVYYKHTFVHARVAELADAHDSKSC